MASETGMRGVWALATDTYNRLSIYSVVVLLAGGDLEGAVQQAAEDSGGIHPRAEAGSGVSQFATSFL